MEIVKLDVSDIAEFKSVLEVLSNVFGDSTIVLYGVVNGDKSLDLICRSGYKVIYMQNGDKINISNYAIDDDYNIDYFAYNGVEYSLTNKYVCAIRNGLMEENLVLTCDMDDDNPYAGHVTYTQYNPETDVEANMRFSHTYTSFKGDVRPRIYDYHLKDMYSLMIDEQARKKPFDWGFMGRKHRYFGNIEIDPETYDIDILAIKEYGLGSYIHEGAYSLLKYDELSRYSRGLFLNRDGSFRCLWPLGYAYKQEELKEILKGYYFKDHVPKDLIEVYNGEHPMYVKVGKMLKQIQLIEKDEAKREEMSTLMKIQP